MHELLVDATGEKCDGTDLAEDLGWSLLVKSLFPNDLQAADTCVRLRAMMHVPTYVG